MYSLRTWQFFKEHFTQIQLQDSHLQRSSVSKYSWIDYATPINLGKEERKDRSQAMNINTCDTHKNDRNNHHLHFRLDMHCLMHLILTPILGAQDYHYLHLVDAKTEA